MKGTVSPKLKDVIISVKTHESEKHKESKLILTMTDEDGFYSVGPMHSDVKYDVSARKDGYVLSEANEKGNFVAMKLGQITVKVTENRHLQRILMLLIENKHQIIANFWFEFDIYIHYYLQSQVTDCLSVDKKLSYCRVFTL